LCKSRVDLVGGQPCNSTLSQTQGREEYMTKRKYKDPSKEIRRARLLAQYDKEVEKARRECTGVLAVSRKYRDLLERLEREE